LSCAWEGEAGAAFFGVEAYSAGEGGGVESGGCVGCVGLTEEGV
jgi:hypothetical protein